jgi:hypothetical protein
MPGARYMRYDYYTVHASYTPVPSVQTEFNI